MKVLEALRGAYLADIPAMLWSGPGAGKTASIRQFARSVNAHLETLIGSTMDPTDVGGWPVPRSDGVVSLSPPSWARRLHEARRAGRRVILFLDELSCAPPSILAPLLRVVHERVVGDLDLTGMWVVAASNPPDSAADGGFLPLAMASRMLHLDFTVDASDWCTGELAGWGDERSESTARAAALTTAYIHKAPSALFGTLKGQNEVRGYACPRSWSGVARYIGSFQREAKDVLLTSTGAMGVKGLIGSASASEFITWATALDLPDPEEMISNPKLKLPERGDVLVAALNAMVMAALRDLFDRRQRVMAAWAVLDRVGRPDIALSPGKALLLGAQDVIPDETIALGKKILQVTGAA